MCSSCKPLYERESCPDVCQPMTDVAQVRLSFRPTTLSDIASLRPMLACSPYRTCDFTVGGLFMWVDYFRYSHCVYDGTLFVRGVSEDDMRVPAFSLPMGALPLQCSIGLLREYCEANGVPLVLSAVPEPVVDSLMKLGAKSAVELTDWADYLYEASPMATFSGKKLSKKRNHVNHFMAENPDHTFEPLDSGNVAEVIEFFENQHLTADKSLSADYERLQVLDVLRHMDVYGFEGEVLKTSGHGIVAFTLGETVGDTLYVHIEKMDHEVSGSGETISSHYVGTMKSRYPGIMYVNREEDTGDEGLRQAKLAYHPVALLRKYNVHM